jgi:hypothetical protein
MAKARKAKKGKKAKKADLSFNFGANRKRRKPAGGGS